MAPLANLDKAQAFVEVSQGHLKAPRKSAAELVQGLILRTEKNGQQHFLSSVDY